MRRPSRINGISGIRERTFSGTHMDFNAAIFKTDRNHPAWKHTSTKAVATVRIRRVWVVGCGEPEPQEEAAMAARGSRESCGPRRDLRWPPEFASESGSADTLKHPAEGSVFILHLPQWN